MKKIISVLICINLLVWAVPLAVYADPAVGEDTLTDIEDYAATDETAAPADEWDDAATFDDGGAITEPPEGAWGDDSGDAVLTPDDATGDSGSVDDSGDGGDSGSDFDADDSGDLSDSDDYSGGEDDSGNTDDSGGGDIGSISTTAYTPARTYAPAQTYAPATVATFPDEGEYDPPKRTQPPLVTGDRTVAEPGTYAAEPQDHEISTPAVVGSISDSSGSNSGGGGIANTAFAVSGGLFVVLVVTGIVLGRIAKREKMYKY